MSYNLPSFTWDNEVIIKNPPVQVFRFLDSHFYGTSWLGMDPESMLLQLDRHRTLITKTEAVDKLMAVKSAAFNINIPCRDCLAFEKIAHAFCNNICVMDAFQPLFIEEVFYTVNQLTEIAKMVDDSIKHLDFRGEIPGYVASVAKHRGVRVLPKPLGFAQDILTFLNGYSPTPDELTLADNLEAMHRSGALDAKAINDNIGDTLQVNSSVRNLIRCYLFDPLAHPLK